ncbi:hypothetical protein, partial [Burkholderia multivorans]|uniref:hypothetical protein n=1 Tax=Burkholderia multivorans TaxID=87883 RepID=UPI001F2C6900
AVRLSTIRRDLRSQPTVIGDYSNTIANTSPSSYLDRNVVNTGSTSLEISKTAKAESNPSR